MKKFFLSDETPDGSLAVMTSPLGDTGLRTDKGQKIEFYPDSHFFVMVKQGETVTNYTIKTNFSITECQEAIYQLTGKRLSPTAPLEEYVSTIATIKPGQDRTIRSVTDVVRVLETIRPSHAYENEKKKKKFEWNEIYQDIVQADKLYNFDAKTQQVLSDFEDYCDKKPRTKHELQKAMARTILLMSDLYYKEEDGGVKELKPNAWASVEPQARSFGQVLEKVSQEKGCQGGGGQTTTISTLSGDRKVVVGGLSGKEWFKCPECPFKANGPIGEGPCPGCGLTKERYKEDSGVACD